MGKLARAEKNKRRIIDCYALWLEREKEKRERSKTEQKTKVEWRLIKYSSLLSYSIFVYYNLNYICSTNYSKQKYPLFWPMHSLFVFVIRLFVNNVEIRICIRIRICENREYSCIRVFAAAPSWHTCTKYQTNYWKYRG